MATTTDIFNAERISTVDYEDSVNVNIDGTVAGPGNTSTTGIHSTHVPVRSKKELKATSCPVESVTVFIDRAEVNRIADTTVDAGENEIIITGLPSVIDEDSLR